MKVDVFTNQKRLIICVKLVYKHNGKNSYTFERNDLLLNEKFGRHFLKL